MAAKKTYLEKMGLAPVRKLTKKICKERVAFLKTAIEKKKFSGKLLERAVYYKNWYGWMGTNGGTRGAKKRAA